MNAKILIAAVAVLFSTITANADSHSNDVLRALGILKGGTPTMASKLVFDDHQRVYELATATEERLRDIARDQAGIWADTILEGDYYADGATQLDRVIVYTRNGEVVAYRITYSERAWDTSDCEFDFDDLETLVACKPGRIVESTYVSHDLNSWTRDLDDLANFNE